MATNWLKQDKEHPLFPDLLWSRPETKRTRGKLLIVGGNLHGFARVAESYSEAEKAGIGSVRIVLPDSLRREVPDDISTFFVPATPSGSLATSSLVELLEQAAWADGVLWAGDLGRNSETAILLEKFLLKSKGQVTLVHDAADYAAHSPNLVQSRPSTLLVVTLAQLQKLLRNAHQPYTISLSMNLAQLVETMNAFSQKWGLGLITKQGASIIVAIEEQASVTATSLPDEDYWRIATATHAAVWQLQNPSRSFEALSASVVTQV